MLIMTLKKTEVKLSTCLRTFYLLHFSFFISLKRLGFRKRIVLLPCLVQYKNGFNNYFGRFKTRLKLDTFYNFSNLL